MDKLGLFYDISMQRKCRRYSQMLLFTNNQKSWIYFSNPRIKVSHFYSYFQNIKILFSFWIRSIPICSAFLRVT